MSINNLETISHLSSHNQLQSWSINISRSASTIWDKQPWRMLLSSFDAIGTHTHSLDSTWLVTLWLRPASQIVMAGMWMLVKYYHPGSRLKGLNIDYMWCRCDLIFKVLCNGDSLVVHCIGFCRWRIPWSSLSSFWLTRYIFKNQNL